MINIKIKDKVISLRKKGYSYSQIRSLVSVSKSTLSEWLREYPLSEKRIRELRDFNPRRIEKYINTMARKRQAKYDSAFQKAEKSIGVVSKRDLFILGFALYWAEGGKTRRNSVTFGNTDPSMLKVFLKWLILLGIPASAIKVKLHLYKDMDEKANIDFWRKTLGVKVSQFTKTYTKESKLTDLTYKNGFGHGTCNIICHNTILSMYVLMGIKYLKENLID